MGERTMSSRESLAASLFFFALGLSLCLLTATGCSKGEAHSTERSASGRTFELLNVSYDPTRELWKDVNEHFVASYEKETGNKVEIKQSHGGSSSQARAVIDGLEADVVTLATYVDTDAIATRGELIDPGWVDELPNRSLPYFSTLVFVVRKGNPK